jgi:hypothetical protein
MAKKKMEDMKFKGVKITNISRTDIGTTPRSLLSKIPSSSNIVTQKDTEVKDTSREEIKVKDTPVYSREPSRRLPSTPSLARKRRSIRKSILIVLLISVLLCGVYWYGYTFQNAKVIINEKHASLILNQEVWTASKDTTSSPIHFEIMIVSDTESKGVVLTESQIASTKAHGDITLFNEYSTKAQTIAANSFVADANGKTYKTDKSITIPGYTTVKGAVVPGQVVVGITAFLTGPSYNGNPVDFYINAFKNGPKYKKIYGKGKTALTGGAEGLTFSLGTEDKGKLDSYANSTFKSNLLKKLNAQVPEGYILYPSALTYDYQVSNDTSSSTANAEIGITGTLSAVLLDRNNLSSAIIKKLLPNTEPEEQADIEVRDLDKLSLSFVNTDEIIKKDTESVSFKLKGTLDAAWHPNTEEIKMSLLGLHKNQVNSIFRRDPGILDATVTLFPRWQSYIPSDPQKIHIIAK